MMARSIIIMMYRWRVFDVGDPYIAYQINITVQQVDYTAPATKSKNQDSTKIVWKTIGYATIGPQMHIDNTNRKKPGVTSGPQVYACKNYDKTLSLNLTSTCRLLPSGKAILLPHLTIRVSTRNIS